MDEYMLDYSLTLTAALLVLVPVAFLLERMGKKVRRKRMNARSK